MARKKIQTKEILTVKDKIEHILDEIRVVLPGTQALLGFQLTAFFSNGFERIPQFLKNLHLLSLGFVTVSTMLLMTPVAYHQIVDRGEDTENFHKFTTKVLVVTLLFLGAGLATDIFVVVSITTHEKIFAYISSLGLLGIFYIFWFGFTLFKRKNK